MESGRKVGSYVVEEPVGRGGMGVVYRGRHEKLPRVVAIKSINPRGTHDLRRLRHRFEREAYVQAQLDHPGIVRFREIGVEESGQIYFVMDYVPGADARAVVRRDGPLPIGRAVSLACQALDALAYPTQTGDMSQAEEKLRNHARHYFEEVWVHRPRKSLGGMRPG